MPQTWQNALDSYRYPVRLADFKDAGMYPGWFEYDTGNGDQSHTVEFEGWFRELAPYHLEAWYEVVFWKLYSQGGRRDRITPNAIANIERSRLTATDLWNLCHDYINNPCKDSFKAFRENLFPSSVVATAATFPAFICPDEFPMVDKRIASWASDHAREHVYCLPTGTIALPVKGNVNSFDQFVGPWYEWCRHTATILSRLTDKHWRARDVEMAVFTAEGSEGALPLNRLG